MPEVAHHNKQLIVLLNVNEVVAAEEQKNIKAMLEETKANA